MAELSRLYPDFQQTENDQKVAHSSKPKQASSSHSNQSENWTFFFDPLILN
jgi:hypothetical protein